MLVRNNIIRTKVTRPGMLVCDVYAECGRAHVQALPFVDETGKLSGRVTVLGHYRNQPWLRRGRWLFNRGVPAEPQAGCIRSAYRP